MTAPMTKPAVTCQRKRPRQVSVPIPASTSMMRRIRGSARSRKASTENASARRCSALVTGDGADEIYEPGDCAHDDPRQKQPVGVQPVVQKFAEQQPDDHCGGKNESDLRVARPNCSGALLAIGVLGGHAGKSTAISN